MWTPLYHCTAVRLWAADGQVSQLYSQKKSHKKEQNSAIPRVVNNTVQLDASRLSCLLRSCHARGCKHMYRRYRLYSG